MGVHVADYVFALANGQEHIVPVRERFEIGFVPTDSFRGPSGLPFLAVTDGKHTLFPSQRRSLAGDRTAADRVPAGDCAQLLPVELDESQA